MYYGSYKRMRDGSWRCLFDCAIDELPVDILKIARMTGTRVIRNSIVNVLDANENGVTFNDGKEWMIIYNDDLPREAARRVIAHEMAHIFLGHDLTEGRYENVKSFKKQPVSEEQAENFACRLLCPACVIWGLELHSAVEISDYCGVDRELAERRAERMRVLYKRNKFLTSDTERLVYENFREYIEKNRSER